MVRHSKIEQTTFNDKVHISNHEKEKELRMRALYVRIVEAKANGLGITLTASDCGVLLNLMHKLVNDNKATKEKHEESRSDDIPAVVQKSWKQPNKRNLKTIKHEIHCKYCDRRLTMYTLSPKTPACCLDCKDKHKLALAKERKKRFNERHKKQ